MPGGLAAGGIRNATAVDAEAVQVFVSNPQGWALSPGDADQDAAFRDHMRQAAIPVFVHAPYLINLGSPTPETARRSVESLAHSLRRGHDIGGSGVVVHTGSAVSSDREAALRQVRDRLLPLLDRLPPEGPDVLLEPMAGQGKSLCATVADIGPYLTALDHHPRLGICLDTCHLFAAGHDLTEADGVRATLDEFDETVGRARLRLLHANDSADACGSRRDRHAGIGDGRIGTAAFARLLHHPVMAGVPVVVETPGGVEQHHRDVDTLRRLRDGRPPWDRYVG